MYCLLFENTALYGECMCVCVCFIEYARAEEEATEGSGNERASNYMTDLASGSL